MTFLLKGKHDLMFAIFVKATRRINSTDFNVAKINVHIKSFLTSYHDTKTLHCTSTTRQDSCKTTLSRLVTLLIKQCAGAHFLFLIESFLMVKIDNDKITVTHLFTNMSKDNTKITLSKNCQNNTRLSHTFCSYCNTYQ